jgi:hypothetical protein
MWVIEPERVGGGDDELAHRPRGQQRVAALGVPEPRQVHCHQVSTLRQAPPDRFEGQQALGPRAEQEGMITVVLAGGKPDGQATDEPELHLEGRVQPGDHDLAPQGPAVGDRIPDIVAPAGAPSSPPGA